MTQDGDSASAPDGAAPRDAGEPWRPAYLDLEYIDPGALERRAGIALKLLAAINGFGVVLALIPPSPPVATLWSVAFNVGSGLLVAIFVVVAVALDRERPWAISAIRPLFAVLLVGGLALLAVAIADGRFRVPFDALFAAWVLLGRPYTRPMPRPDGRSIGATVAAVGLFGLMLGSGPLFRWGGVLDFHPSDLSTTLAADCTTHEPGTDLPQSVVVTYDWTWRSWQPFASGVDAIVLGWDGNDATGRVQYFVGLTPETEPGVRPGRREYQSAEMATAIMGETRSQWVWGVFLEQQRYRAGHVELRLRLVNGERPAEPLRIRATYVHEGVWRHDTATVACAW
ncbi:MAG TPA: hypothetical protein VNL94_04210 [Candidatus Binatia bacterium]|nr:hypothetical protein [Candidatus Binatia bacterium]